MDDNLTITRMALIRAIQIVKCAAEMLHMNPLMPWDELQNVTILLRLEQRGLVCPSFEQLVHFLGNIPYHYSQQFFRSVKYLMETMTNEQQPFGSIMGHYVRREDEQKRRRYWDDDVPPPIKGVPNDSYSCDLWRLVMRVNHFQTSLRPVTLRCVISSCDMFKLSSSQCDMMASRTAQHGFYLRCVMHGMTPRLKLATMSPGMFFIFLRRILANACRSEQDCRQIRAILARYYCLNRRMLRNI